MDKYTNQELRDMTALVRQARNNAPPQQYMQFVVTLANATRIDPKELDRRIVQGDLPWMR